LDSGKGKFVPAPKLYVGKEPPQSARVAQTSNDWNKKPKTDHVESKPTTAASRKSESPTEKLKKEQERKKIREEAMKNWREKWTSRE
jgi:hypothetical protein